jgi:hypothetical protein
VAATIAVGLVQVVALIALKPLKSWVFLMQKLTNKVRLMFTAPGIALVAAVVIHRAHQ